MMISLQVPRLEVFSDSSLAGPGTRIEYSLIYAGILLTFAFCGKDLTSIAPAWGDRTAEEYERGVSRMLGRHRYTATHLHG
jgi:hypothetical protein